MEGAPQPNFSDKEKQEIDEIEKDMLSKWVPEEHTGDYDLPSHVAKSPETKPETNATSAKTPEAKTPDVQYSKEQRMEWGRQRGSFSSGAMRSGSAEKKLAGDIINEYGITQSEKPTVIIDLYDNEIIQSPEAAERKLSIKERLIKLKERVFKGIKGAFIGREKKTINEPDPAEYIRNPKIKEFIPIDDKNAAEILAKGSPEENKKSLERKKKETKSIQEIKIKERDPRIRGYLWERMKGLGTFGITELYQAEKFRRGSKKTGKEAARLSSHLKQTGAVTMEELWRQSVDKENPETYQKFSERVSKERMAENRVIVELIVKDARQQLEERLKKYKNASGKQIVFDKGRVDKMMEGLQTKLVSMQEGPKETDAKEMTKIIRDNLDPRYWQRYIYAGVEAGIWAGAGWWVWAKYGATKIVSGAAGGEAAREFVEKTKDVPMHKHIWETVRQFMIDHGISNPTDKQIWAGSKIVAHNNGVGIKVLGENASIMDTKMLEGHLLKMGELAKELPKIIANQ